MENHEEKQGNDAVEGKITTFASPTVLAAILDHVPVEHDVAHIMVDVNEEGQNSEMVSDSLDTSLNDSLESTELREIGELKRLDPVHDEGPIFSTNDAKSNLPITEEVSDFPKSSTPIKSANETKSRTTEKASKPRPSQHIIERNKEKAGKRSPTKSSYAQMHAIKARNKLSKVEKKTNVQENTTHENLLGSDVGDNLDNSYVANHVGRQYLDLNSTTSELEEQESDLLDNSDLNGSFNTFHNHGPYYDVSQHYSTYDSNYVSDPVSYVRGYHSATAHFRQSHAIAEPIRPEMHYNNLSTQSAPPRVYGYHRKPLLSSVHHFSDDDSHRSSVLPNNDYGRDKIPESGLHRKFSSEPYLVHSRSPSLQKMVNVDRNSKVSGSYSSLQQPISYKPYTLKDYHTFTGSKVKPLAGGLGPNVDTDDFKEKMKKVSKQREYATMLRAHHSNMKKQQQSRGPAPLAAKPQHVKEAELKRQTALNYAKNVPKPKPMTSRKLSNSGSGRGRDEKDVDNEDDQEITVLEILRLRHEQEKKEVDSIRKDLASKIRL